MSAPYRPHDIDHELSGCCLDCEPGFALVKRHLVAFHDRIAGSSVPADESLTFEDIRELYAELDDIVRLHAPSDDFVAHLLDDSEVRAILPDLRAAYSSYFERHERDFAKHLLGVEEPWTELKRFIFHPNYVSLTDAECDLAGLRRGDAVVFLGCGPLPLTNVLLASRHGLSTVGIEDSREAASLARQVVDRLGLARDVRIAEGDHRWLTAQTEFDLVIVAAQAKPRRRVLEYLRSALPPGSRVSLRIYEKGLRRILSDEEGEWLPEGLTPLGTGDPGDAVNNTIVLLEVSS